MILDLETRLYRARGEVVRAESYLESVTLTGDDADRREARADLAAARANLEAIERDACPVNNPGAGTRGAEV